MKYALNIKKGTVVNHPRVGKLEAGIARKIDDEEANMLKSIYGIVIFDSVQE